MHTNHAQHASSQHTQFPGSQVNNPFAFKLETDSANKPGNARTSAPLFNLNSSKITD